MMSYEELETLVNEIKGKLDETTSALISEDLLNIISNYKLGIDEISRLSEEVGTLKSEKDELLKVNGRLFQKVGFDKEEEKEEETSDDVSEELTVEDVIDEKGELI
jgi:Phi29 scaffolding protein.